MSCQTRGFAQQMMEAPYPAQETFPLSAAARAQLPGLVPGLESYSDQKTDLTSAPTASRPLMAFTKISSTKPACMTPAPTTSRLTTVPTKNLSNTQGTSPLLSPSRSQDKISSPVLSFAPPGKISLNLVSVPPRGALQESPRSPKFRPVLTCFMCLHAPASKVMNNHERLVSEVLLKAGQL